MIRKCKKCGCDALIKNGDWYECPVCGAMMFDVSIFVGNVESPTKELEKIDEGKGTDISFTHSNSYREAPAQSEKIVYEEPAKADDTDFDDEYEVKEKKQKVKKEKAKKEKRKKKADKSEKDEKPKSKLREGIQFFTPIVIALVIAILLKTFIFANAVVPSGSMLNTIKEGDRIVASRLAYINEAPQRYDIIIFHYPDDESQLFVKRIIGMPGETVQIVDGIVYVTDSNGSISKIRDDFVTNCVPDGNFGPYTVPLGSYFVMGDNRNDSWDSRYWDKKCVEKSKILGKVKFRYYPKPSKIE